MIEAKEREAKVVDHRDAFLGAAVGPCETVAPQPHVSVDSPLIKSVATLKATTCWAM
jgi:hypothetical protein